MTFLPICQHPETRWTRLVRGGQVSRCASCGVEFVTAIRYANSSVGNGVVPKPR